MRPFIFSFVSSLFSEVCSSNMKRYGIFRLTVPVGLREIQQCRGNGFHRHSRPDHELYCEAERPAGHVFENDGFKTVVFDLRPGH